MAKKRRRVLVVSSDLKTRVRARLSLEPFVDIHLENFPETALRRIPQLGHFDAIVVFPGDLRRTTPQFVAFVEGVLALGFSGVLQVASDTPDNVKVLKASGCNLTSRQDNMANKLFRELGVT